MKENESKSDFIPKSRIAGATRKKLDEVVSARAGSQVSEVISEALDIGLDILLRLETAKKIMIEEAGAAAEREARKEWHELPSPDSTYSRPGKSKGPTPAEKRGRG